LSLTAESRDVKDREFGFAGGEGFLAPWPTEISWDSENPIEIWDISGYFWIFLDISVYFWIFLDISGYFWIQVTGIMLGIGVSIPKWPVFEWL